MDSSLAPQSPLPYPPHQGEGTGEIKSKAFRIRFSLRALLVLVTLLGLLTYWQSRPAQLADRFVAAVMAGKYATADDMFQRDSDRFLADMAERSHRIEIKARREPANWLDRIKGVSRVKIVVDDASGWNYYTTGGTIEVTRGGVQQPQWDASQILAGPAILEPLEASRQ